MKIVKVEVLDGYRLKLTFNDGVQGVADLADLAGRGVFGSWRDRRQFQSVTVGDSGELVWNEQGDLCADALYLRVTHKSPEEIFPSLRKTTSRA